MLDFEKFKQNMLDCKKGVVDVKEPLVEESKDNLLTFDEFWKMQSEPLDKANGWVVKMKKKEYDDGMTC